ncbi:general transcription factor IIH subunit 3-like [Drosophila montana]|uniref:general transcription factor IIH subunit 3-like n=1 Tax=Drosophila montana TaxID=40370 RepID=UPI00313C413F
MMRHAANITGGFYFGTSEFKALGMNLPCLFLMPPQRRHHFNYPKQPPTDLRAVCYCRNKLIEIGFAYRNCLSISCKNSPICGN